MSANKWFKFYGGEYLSDPKIGTLSPQERSCWVTLLCLASISSVGGIIEYLTIEVLLQKSGINLDPYHPEEWEKCLGILKKLERMKMIKTNTDGVIEVIHWETRQESSLTGYERVKRHREKSSSSLNARGNSIELPEWLDKKVWAKWLEYKKEKKEKMTPSTIESQLKRLEKFGIENHVAVIEQSIANGWRGVFELKEGRTKKQTRDI